MLRSSSASPASASFHIDADRGNDNADGRTEASAWRTFKRANNRTFAPGETLLLKAGCRWSGQLRLQGSGTEANVIRVGRYGSGPLPLIAADGKTDAAVILENSSHWVMEDLEVTNTIPGGERRDGMLGVQVVADAGGVMRNITLRRLHVHHVSGGWDRGGSGVLACSTGDNDQNGTRKTCYDGLTIEDCYVHDVSFYGIFVNGWENRFRDETWNPSRNVVIRNNFTHDTGGDSIVVLACDKPLIEHNEAHRCAIGQSHGGRTPAAGMWPHSSDGTVMRYNRVLDIDAVMDGQGFDVDISCRNTVVEYNWSQRNRGGFILLCSPDSKVAGTCGVIVRHNVSIDDGQDIGVITIAGDVSDVKILNNAFLDRNEGVRPMLHPFTPKGSREGKTDVLIASNIFSTSGTYTFQPSKLVVPSFEGNTYAGSFQGFPGDLSGRNADYPAVTIDNGKVAPTSPGTTFKPFEIGKAGLLPTSSWLEQRNLSASGNMK